MEHKSRKARNKFMVHYPSEIEPILAGEKPDLRRSFQ
jgi:hypothetical protein